MLGRQGLLVESTYQTEVSSQDPGQYLSRPTDKPLAHLPERGVRSAHGKVRWWMGDYSP
jgi:hypothetical protein